MMRALIMTMIKEGAWGATGKASEQCGRYMMTEGQ